MDLKEFNKVASSNGAQVDKTGINFPLTGRDEDFSISIITDDFPLIDFALVREDGDVVYELGQYEMDENFYQRLVSTVRKACSRYGISNFSRFSTFLKRVTTSKTSASLKRSIQTASAASLKKAGYLNFNEHSDLEEEYGYEYFDKLITQANKTLKSSPLTRMGFKYIARSELLEYRDDSTIIRLFHKPYGLAASVDWEDGEYSSSHEDEGAITGTTSADTRYFYEALSDAGVDSSLVKAIKVFVKDSFAANKHPFRNALKEQANLLLASATDTFMNNLERLFKGIARKNNLKVDYIPTIARTEWEEVEEGSVLSKKTRDGEYCWIIGNDSGWNGNGEDGIAIMLDGEDSNIGTTGVQTSYTTLIKEAEKLAKNYGLTLPREIVNVAKDLKAKKVLASFGDSNMNISETKAVTAHLLMAALQVKAGNLRKAQRIMASLDDEEVDEAIDQNLDVLDEAEEAEIQDDPFLLGEEASNEDNFDLSPEDDDVEAEYEDDEEVEDEDEPAETARFRSSHRRKQTASLQRQNNVRLLRAANKR